MAYNIHWKIKFKSLRAGTDYTVNIYKNGSLPSGYPLTLNGGAQPFVTEEDDNDDQFTPIRTQTGYIRIVDDGKAINDSNVEVAYNWKELLPLNDTDRPVTLTDGNGNVVWAGFMQAQNFGGRLFGNPQEREYPVQCPITVTENNYIGTSNTKIQNFAYLLKNIVDSIPSVCRPESFVFQGGDDAIVWLQKCIDWQNFIAQENDFAITAKYTAYQCLEDMCRFWGWTVRIVQKVLMFTCADDNTETWALVLNESQLANIANGGTPGGIVSVMFMGKTLFGDVFASINNEEYMVRGYGTAIVKADANKADLEVIKFAPAGVESYLKAQSGTTATGVVFYGDMTSFPISNAPSPFLEGSCLSNYASFTYAVSTQQALGAIQNSVIRFKKSYNGSVLASLTTVYEHSYYTSTPFSVYTSRGGIQLCGVGCREGKRIEDYHNDTGIGKKHVIMRLGIGKTRETAKWWANTGWSSTVHSFYATIGNQDNILRIAMLSGTTITGWLNYLPTSQVDLVGKIFIEFLGSNDLSEVDGERSFYLTDFAVNYSRLENLTNGIVTEGNYKSEIEYKSSNGNNVSQEWNAYLAYASENNMEFGYGVVLNTDGTQMEGVSYNGGASEHPEQHLANRVTAFGAQAKRKVYAEVRSNLSGTVTPRYKVTVDGTVTHPIAIGHNWRDDVMKLTLLEM